MKRHFALILICLMALFHVPTTLHAQKKRPVAVAKKKQVRTPQKPVRPGKKQKIIRKKKLPVKGAKIKYTNSSIRGLQNEREKVKKEIHIQEQALKQNKQDVETKLKELLDINNEINQRKENIQVINQDITHIEKNVDILNAQLGTLEKQLDEIKQKYIKSVRYMSMHRTTQDKLMFIFSAKNLVQMYRRMRFVNEYAAYQKTQGEIVKNKQNEVEQKKQQLTQTKQAKNVLVRQGQKEQQQLETQKDAQQQVVQGLKKQQKVIEKIIGEQRKKDAELNAQIDRLIAIEIEKARKRAEEEARRRAEEIARKKAEEIARKKAEAEAAARENARRIAEAKERERVLREQAEQRAREAEQARVRAQAEQQAQAEQRAREAERRRQQAEQAAREAQSQRMAAERKAQVDNDRSSKEIEQARQRDEEVRRFTKADRMISGGFEANRGRLPMPITGSYRIVSHYGQYNVEGLQGVRLDNKGINIMGRSGCRAMSIYDGEVSAVFGFSGTYVVMVRHGAYISVYCNLKSPAVAKGNRVSTGQILGTVADDNILQFQLRKETTKLNPEAWLRR